MSDLRQFTSPREQFLDSNGVPLAGGFLYFYEAGTTTPLDTYPDATLDPENANPNPIELDAAGRSGAIYMAADNYKIVLTDAEGVTIWTQDDYQITNGSSFGEGLESSGGSIRVAAPVTVQTGTAYSFASTDRGKLNTFSNANAIAGTIAEADDEDFPDGWYTDIQNRGPGVFTLTPTTSTIDGAATLELSAGQGARIYSDGTNYYTLRSFQLSSPYSLENYSLAASVAGNALTINLKDRAGNAPSNGSPAKIAFRNATAATGDYSVLSVTSALSLTVSSGSTLGTSSNTAFRLWIVAFNDGGTIRLGVINCMTSTGVVALDEKVLKSSTAEGGAGAADSAGVIYTGTAVATKAFRILGYVQYDSGLGTAGTWSAGPDVIQLDTPGVHKPGSVVQVRHSQTGAATTGTTVTPNDDTIPRNDEGDQFMTGTIGPTSKCNWIQIEAIAVYALSSSFPSVMALHQDSVVDALAAVMDTQSNATNVPICTPLRHGMQANTVSDITYKIRIGTTSAATVTFNGVSVGRKMGGVMASGMTMTEIAA